MQAGPKAGPINNFESQPNSFRSVPLHGKNILYDAEDCQAANEKIKQLIESNTIAFTHTENKYKTFISLFQQLQLKIQ
jgi:hypothetical protein